MAASEPMACNFAGGGGEGVVPNGFVVWTAGKLVTAFCGVVSEPLTATGAVGTEDDVAIGGGGDAAGVRLLSAGKRLADAPMPSIVAAAAVGTAVGAEIEGGNGAAAGFCIESTGTRANACAGELPGP